jgi:transcriptional regulator with XRE-family HTH domain
MKKVEYNNLKIVLAKLGITEKDVAKGMKKSPVTVSRWCTNDQQPSLPMMFDIADFLKIDVMELIPPNKYSSRKR